MARQSIDIAAARVCFPCFFVESNGSLVQIIAFSHEFVHCFSSFQQILQVLMDHLLHFLQFMLDSQKLVSLERILPFTKVHLELSELDRVVRG